MTWRGVLLDEKSRMESWARCGATRRPSKRIDSRFGGVVAHRLLILRTVKAPRRVERGAAQSRSHRCEPPGEGIHRAERAQKGGHKRSADEGRRVFRTACAGLAGSMERPLPVIEARVVLCGHGGQSRPRTHNDICRTDSDENN